MASSKKENKITLIQNETAGLNATVAQKKHAPVIVFGGMGSSCKDPVYINLMNKLKKGLDNQHVECYETHILGSIKAQAMKACKYVSENENYNKQKEINLVGVSQGGLLARYMVEECPLSNTKPRNLLTIGSPNMGL